MRDDWARKLVILNQGLVVILAEIAFESAWAGSSGALFVIDSSG